MIKEFLKRNAIVFILCGLMLLFFLVVTILSASNTESEVPTLKKVTQQQEAELLNSQQPTINPNEPIQLAPPVVVDSETEQIKQELGIKPEPIPMNEVDQEYGTLDIEFTPEGFNPDRVTGYLGQTVIWTNTTNETIILSQTKDLFDDWVGQDKIIQPQQNYRYVLSENGLWTYREKISEKHGAILISTPYKFKPIDE